MQHATYTPTRVNLFQRNVSTDMCLTGARKHSSQLIWSAKLLDGEILKSKYILNKDGCKARLYMDPFNLNQWATKDEYKQQELDSDKWVT